MNPFRQTIVADPWNAPHGDVSTIHQNVFDECLRGIEHVRNTRQSTALLIHGEAGSGKTHLLGRLRATLALKGPAATDRNEALYVWVRLQTSPRMIWRTVRRTLVSDWFRPLDESRCQFDRILFHRLAAIRVAEGDLEPWHEYMLQEDPDGLKELIERIAADLDLDRNTSVAFEHLAFGRFRRDLKAWLSGDSLPDSVLQRMELMQGQESDEDREDLSRQVVLMLCRLAGNGLPIVLSFDQVEALETNPGDREAMFAFGQLVSSIHDSTTNVFIVSSVQSAFAIRLSEQAREADLDRMKSFGALSLAPLSREEAEALIKARLQATEVTVPQQAIEQPLWPLSETQAGQLFSEGSVSPRRLLARCADQFDLLQQSPTRTAAETGFETAEGSKSRLPSFADRLSQFLADTWQTTIAEKLAINSPDRTEDILEHALPTAVRCLAANVNSVRDDQLRDVSLVLEGASGRTGICICAQSNMTSLAAQLKRLSRFEQRRVERLVIVRDSRVPVSPTAKKARERLKDLESRGAVVVYPTLEVFVALDALRSLLSDAKSGDLSCCGETVAPKTLEEWLAAHIPQDLRAFIEEITGQNDGTPEARNNSDAVSLEALNAVLRKRPVMELTRVAEELACAVDELIPVVRRHPNQFGLLGRPPAVLFRITGTLERLPDCEE